jgi:hypothetical protein
MEINMKKILWTALGIIGLVNNSVAVGSRVGIHFHNNTSSTIYLVGKYIRNPKSCKKDKFTKVITVESGNKYKIAMIKTKMDEKICFLSLLGYTNANLSESSIALQEKFHIKFRDLKGNYVSLHESPPSKCGLGMTCSTHLPNTESFYIKVTSKHNQYAHIMLNNNTGLFRYIKFTRLRGKCNKYVKHNPWFKVIPRNVRIGYFLNPHENETCLYKVEIAGDNQGNSLICSSILKIYNDSDNATISSEGGNCNIVLSNNNWLASINLNKQN